MPFHNGLFEIMSKSHFAPPPSFAAFTFTSGATLVCISIYLYGLPKQDTPKMSRQDTDSESKQKLITVWVADLQRRKHLLLVDQVCFGLFWGHKRAPALEELGSQSLVLNYYIDDCFRFTLMWMCSFNPAHFHPHGTGDSTVNLPIIWRNLKVFNAGARGV